MYLAPLTRNQIIQLNSHSHISHSPENNIIYSVIFHSIPTGILMDSGGGSRGSQSPPKLGGGGGGLHQHLNPSQNHLFFFNHHLLKAALFCCMVTLTSVLLYQASESPFQILRRSIYSSFSFYSHASDSICSASVSLLLSPVSSLLRFPFFRF